MTPNHDIQAHIYVVDIDLLSFAELQKRAECIRGNIEKGNNAYRLILYRYLLEQNIKV